MHKIRTIFLLVVFSLVFGCQASNPGTSTGVDIRTQDQLVEAIQAAHEKQELSALEKISHLEGVDTMTRDSITGSFNEVLTRKILEVAIEPLDPKVELKYSIGGKVYYPNLSPEGRIRISYRQSEGSSDHLTSTTFLFGKVEGQYRLGFAASKAE